jgi:hypothetical protein
MLIMSDRAALQPEIKASIEAHALFDALSRGDLSEAARAQKRLRSMGWTVTRERPKPPNAQKAVTG